MKVVDHSGRRFGRLLVLSSDGVTASGHKRWKCKCDCGNDYSVRGTLLTQGEVVSCGCYAIEAVTKRETTHGLYYHPLYQTWRGMMGRCQNENGDDYTEYGGRGIKVCERWHNIENFITDMGVRPSGMSIDRIDVNGNYEPSNCRWADAKTQANNTRTNRHLTHDGRVQTLSQWADEVGIGVAAIFGRLKRGWSTSDALTIPVNSGNRYAKIKTPALI